MKFKEVAPLWVEYKLNFVKRSSMSSYTLLLQNHVLPTFGDIEDKIEEQTVQDFVLKKSNDGLSNKTIGDILIVLKMILKFAHKRKLFEYVPFEDIVFPVESKRHGMEVLTIQETNTLIKAVKENFSFRNLGILISISTGIRIGEVCALQWADIDTETGVLTVNKTIQRIYILDGGKKRTELIIDEPKTSSSNRQIPISADLMSIIKPLKKIVNPSFYVLSNDAKPTEPRTYRCYYVKVMKRLDLPVMKFHGLRHSFATRCINANIDIKTVSVLLGHSNISTTLNVYAHPNMEQKKSAITKMFKSLK